MTLDSPISSQAEHSQAEMEPPDAADLSRSWKAFARSPELPPIVKKLMLEVVSLESELGEKLVFGGPRGNLQVQLVFSEIPDAVIAKPWCFCCLNDDSNTEIVIEIA
jgi:hypothetical protein